MSMTPRRPDLSVPRLWCRRRCPGDAGMHLLLLGPWTLSSFARANFHAHTALVTVKRTAVYGECRVRPCSLFPEFIRCSPLRSCSIRSLASAMQDPWHHINHYMLYSFEISYVSFYSGTQLCSLDITLFSGVVQEGLSQCHSPARGRAAARAPLASW